MSNLSNFDEIQVCTAPACGRWLQLEGKREKTKRSSKASRAKLKKHEIEERDKRQAATNIMYMLCNELNLSNI